MKTSFILAACIGTSIAFAQEPTPPVPPAPNPERPRVERPRPEAERARREQGDRPDGDRPDANRRFFNTDRPFAGGPADRRAQDGKPGDDRARFAREMFERVPKGPQTYLGVITRGPGSDLSAQLRQPEGFGLVVEQVLLESPAKSAGLERNDFLLRYDDQLIVNVPQLEALTRRTGKDKDATLTIIRGGAEQKITIKIAEKTRPERKP